MESVGVHMQTSKFLVFSWGSAMSPRRVKPQPPGKSSTERVSMHLAKLTADIHAKVDSIATLIAYSGHTSQPYARRRAVLNWLS